MNRYNEAFKILMELMAVMWGLYQLVSFSLANNALYWLFLGLWMFYLLYEGWVKLRHRLSTVPIEQKELRLSHRHDQAFGRISFMAAILVVVALGYVCLFKRRALEHGEWLFIGSAMLYVGYAFIHIPTIWIEVEDGILRGSQLKEKIAVASIHQLTLSAHELVVVGRDERIQKIKYLKLKAEEKQRAHAFFSSFLHEPQQTLLIM